MVYFATLEFWSNTARTKAMHLKKHKFTLKQINKKQIEIEK